MRTGGDGMRCSVYDDDNKMEMVRMRKCGFLFDEAAQHYFESSLENSQRTAVRYM